MDQENQIKEILSRLDSGLTLDWTDIRIYLIVVLSSLIGGVIAAYFTKYFGKRGEINAIKKDLDEITKIQSEIKSKINTDAFINQNWWNLKREIYWGIIKSLNSLSDAYFNVITQCFNNENQAIADPDIYTPYINKLLQAFDNYLELTGVSHVVMGKEGIKIIVELANKMKIKSDDIVNKRFSYDEMQAMHKSVNEAYDKMIDAAKSDLKDENV